MPAGHHGATFCDMFPQSDKWAFLCEPFAEKVSNGLKSNVFQFGLLKALGSVVESTSYIFVQSTNGQDNLPLEDLFRLLSELRIPIRYGTRPVLAGNARQFQTCYAEVDSDVLAIKTFNEAQYADCRSFHS